MNKPMLRGLVVVMTAGLTLPACGRDIFAPIPFRQEEYKQNAAAKIDALWVVDNSESMAEEQQGLGESFQAFIDTLLRSQVDYHIGVVSTDAATRGRLNKPSGVSFIEPTTPDAKGTFIRNVSVGTQGSRLETGFEAAALALGMGEGWEPRSTPVPPFDNSGFLRPDAALFIIMVSDEDDKSFGPVGYYTRLFEAYKGAGNENLVSVSAIAGPTDATTATATSGGAEPRNKIGCYDARRGNAKPGYRYAELAQQTGGIMTSICSDFNASLTELSITAAGLRSVFPLEGRPDRQARVDCQTTVPQSICVAVNGVVIAESTSGSRQGFRYDDERNAIVFAADNIPLPQATITVSFEEVLR